jgi:hypothetical protein
MKHGSGIKDRDDKSNGIEILITEVFAKINPTDPSDSSVIHLPDQIRRCFTMKLFELLMMMILLHPNKKGEDRG